MLPSAVPVSTFNVSGRFARSLVDCSRSLRGTCAGRRCVRLTSTSWSVDARSGQRSRRTFRPRRFRECSPHGHGVGDGSARAGGRSYPTVALEQSRHRRERSPRLLVDLSCEVALAVESPDLSSVLVVRMPKRYACLQSLGPSSRPPPGLRLCNDGLKLPDRHDRFPLSLTRQKDSSRQSIDSRLMAVRFGADTATWRPVLLTRTR